MTIAYANYCGSEGDLEYCGGSLVVGRDAKPLVKAGNAECFLIVDLDGLKDIDPQLRSEQVCDQ